jgi:trigger factor
MELNFNKTDDLHATLTVALGKEDYNDAVEKQLKKSQKQMSIKGFRPGHAPMGMIKSMYGKSILAEEINKIASQKLFDYLKENNIDILAQPLPSASVKSDVDIENKQDFTFAFDLGLAPRFEFNISDKDVLDYYVISVDDAEVDKEIESLTMRFGEMSPVEVSEEKDIVYADLTELDENNTPKENGLANKNVSFTPELVKNEALKASLIGLKKGDELTINIFELLNDNVTVISSSLGIDK